MLYRMQIPELRPEEVIDYLRKSRSDNPLWSVEEVLENHEADLDEWAQQNLGDVVPQKNKFREVVSGETLKERPEIKKVLRLIESPNIKAVKCYDLTRLTRGDLEDVGRLMKLFKLTDTLIITVKPVRVFNLRDQYDWEAVEREFKQGNYYLEYFKKISNAGRLASVARGNFIGSVPPYGYEKTVEYEDKRKCPTLKIKEDEANVVRMIFDMYVNQDMGRTNICHRLDKLGIKPPKGKKWSPSALKDLLENDHYTGKTRWNWRKTVAIVEEGQIFETRPKTKYGEYLIFEGRHKAIIDEELFRAARAKQGRNHRAKPNTKVRNPLAGLVFCQCGRAMSLRTYNNKGKKQQEPRLLCDDQTHCKTASCLYNEMIERVVEILENCIEDFELRIKNSNEDSVKLHADLIRRLEKKEKELEKKELSQWEKYSEENMPKHIFDNLNAKVLAEKEEVRQALCKARESMPEPVDYKEKVLRFKDALEMLNDPEASADKKNSLLKACIDRIEYSRGQSVRLTKDNCEQYGVKPENFTRGGNWYTPPIEITVKLRV